MKIYVALFPIGVGKLPVLKEDAKYAFDDVSFIPQSLRERCLEKINKFSEAHILFTSMSGRNFHSSSVNKIRESIYKNQPGYPISGYYSEDDQKYPSLICNFCVSSDGKDEYYWDQAVQAEKGDELLDDIAKHAPKFFPDMVGPNE